MKYLTCKAISQTIEFDAYIPIFFRSSLERLLLLIRNLDTNEHFYPKKENAE